MKAVNNGNGDTFFLYGYGGTGKTFIWKTLASELRSENHSSHSGIKWNNIIIIARGRTTHSKLAIPVPTIENSTCNIHQGSELVELLKQTKLIIWDEAPMTHNLSPSHSSWPFKLTRRQFPLTVSYAMTINKSQGQSLASVGLYLPRPVFGHGQLYYAFSRVQSMEGHKILIHDKEEKTMNTTINVVFKEVFQNL
ncbi:hypothetical protein Lal_00011045 [Lupinus albus]|nr:hypothetical protein Lal_00011045 [Lupinus albus]